MGGGGGEERLGLWCTFEVASPTVHTTFEGGASWGEGGRSISAATSNLLSTSRITESALWNLLKVRVRRGTRRHLEGRLFDTCWMSWMGKKRQPGWKETPLQHLPQLAPSHCGLPLFLLLPPCSIFLLPPLSALLLRSLCQQAPCCYPGWNEN